MLEQPALLIRPWQGKPRRAWIVEPGSATRLGFVCRRRPSGPLGWLAWWRRSGLAVHESEDEPLLLTVQQTLFPWRSWLVRDADGRPVGRVRDHRLLDAFNQPLAELQMEEHSGASAYRDRERALAVTRQEEEGVRLTFQPGQRENPFVKMVLLAATLIHNQSALTGRETGSRPGRPLAAPGS
jgi:hypothetical protein